MFTELATIFKFDKMSVGLSISIPQGLYLRDPQMTTLGRSIIKHSILLIDDIGFECFTFRKLAEKMGSNETSLYRYFENKHMLLLYLEIWYWNWVSYLLDINTRNIDDPKRKMKIIVETIVDATKENPSTEYVNEKVLHRIIISEGSKAYHTKKVDEENKEGFFTSYKELCQKIADVILELDPAFPYSHSMASSFFEMANNQIYFAEHLPRLTDVKVAKDNYDEVVNLLWFYVERMLIKCP